MKVQNEQRKGYTIYHWLLSTVRIIVHKIIHIILVTQNSRSPCLDEIALPSFAFFLARPKQASILSMRVPFSLGMIQKRQQLFFHITLLFHALSSTVCIRDYSANSLNYIIVHYWMCLLILTHNSGCLNKLCNYATISIKFQ